MPNMDFILAAFGTHSSMSLMASIFFSGLILILCNYCR